MNWLRSARRITSLILCLLVVIPGWCDDPSPIEIPKRGDPRWTFSAPDDRSLSAPRGYEGRSDTSSMTVTGHANVPGTEGKTVFARFELSNQIKTCPTANGDVEGTGVFSFTVKTTNNQADESRTISIDRHADAKYKGRVGENGYLEGSLPTLTSPSLRQALPGMRVVVSPHFPVPLRTNTCSTP